MEKELREKAIFAIDKNYYLVSKIKGEYWDPRARSPTTLSTMLKKRPLGAAREYRRDKKLPLRKRSSSGFPTAALKPTSPKRGAPPSL